MSVSYSMTICWFTGLICAGQKLHWKSIEIHDAFSHIIYIWLFGLTDAIVKFLTLLTIELKGFENNQAQVIFVEVIRLLFFIKH